MTMTLTWLLLIQVETKKKWIIKLNELFKYGLANVDDKFSVFGYDC